jgi:phosphoglycerol transferase MdoB-like AlkP superfamily enzyme
VEEGVTWFAQGAPRQPRRLVVVIPPLAWVFAPLPLVFAFWGLCASRRGNGRFADVLWCAATLAAKPLILVHTALLEPTAVAFWLIVAVAIIVPALGLVLLPSRLRPWALLAVGIFCSLLILADVVYYRFFGDVLSTPATLAAHQTGQVWGSIRTVFTPGLLWLVADWPVACWLPHACRAEGRLCLRARRVYTFRWPQVRPWQRLW